MDNLCVFCGKEIPEGRQVCMACEEGFTVRNRETLRKLEAIAEEIGSALIESFEIAQDIEPKTIPPRSPVRCIGCRPETRNRKPTIILRGCRHK